MVMKFKKLISISCAVIMAVFVFAGCGAGDSTVPETNADMTDLTGAYAFVGKDIHNTYMQKVYEGFETACREKGISPVYEAPEASTPEKQIEIIENLVDRGVSGIAVAANDVEMLAPSLQDAMQKGIKIISLDSAVSADSRLTHIQQADPEKIGRELIKSAYDIVGGNGGIAILSSTDQATNQNLWIDYMNKEINENPEKYANTPVVTIAYGDDDMMKSITETEAILQNKDVKVIIAPTAVGIVAAAQTLSSAETDIKLTGLGLPSQMSEYIESGMCPVMFLWNPVDIGYLAGCTLDAAANGMITGAVGESFSAGSMGNREIKAATDGGSEVLLGDLLRFDKSNINDWKDMY